MSRRWNWDFEDEHTRAPARLRRPLKPPQVPAGMPLAQVRRRRLIAATIALAVVLTIRFGSETRGRDLRDLDGPAPNAPPQTELA